jgi:CNT family concentrative nucleoside transporter
MEEVLTHFTGLLGLLVFLAIAYGLSTNRRAIRWRTVVWGLSLQTLFAILVVRWPYGQSILQAGSTLVTSVLSHSVDGSSMVFGRLGTPGDALSIFAFAVLPTADRPRYFWTS